MQQLDELTATITRLEKHIESQDIEVYRQQRQIDALQKQLKKLADRIDVAEQGGESPGSPADERPPHY